MKTCREVAAEWGLAERSVNYLCQKGKIPGAVKKGHSWEIPEGAVKPADGRVSSKKYEIKPEPAVRKALPVGITDYIRAQAEYYYVDKTLLLQEFLERRPLVTLFTRPDGFGKTLNLDMLRVFFEKTAQDTSVYFRDKAIWKCSEACRAHQGQYPVIYLTFKDLKQDSWEAALEKLAGLLQEEFGRHPELAESDRLPAYEKAYYARILSGSAGEVELSCALEKLSGMLAKHYGRAPVILIDEYDTPFRTAAPFGFYPKLSGFLRNFFSGGLKDNKNLSYGFLAGTQQVAQEILFGEMGHLAVSSALDPDYASCFGFTCEEVRAMLEAYGAGGQAEEVQARYGGYCFGGRELYNPRSVICSLAGGGTQACMGNSGRHVLPKEALKEDGSGFSGTLVTLLQGDTVLELIESDAGAENSEVDPASIIGSLLAKGYLTAKQKRRQEDGTYLCEVAIPNREAAAMLKRELLSHLCRIGKVSRTNANEIVESLYAKDTKKLKKALAAYLERAAGSVEYTAGIQERIAGASETVGTGCGGLLPGLVALLDPLYRIRTGRESGDGRCDIRLVPQTAEYPEIRMVLKTKKNLGAWALDALAAEALAQTEDLRFDSETRKSAPGINGIRKNAPEKIEAGLQEAGINGAAEILKFGIAVSGKTVIVRAGNSGANG